MPTGKNGFNILNLHPKKYVFQKKKIPYPFIFVFYSFINLVVFYELGDNNVTYFLTDPDEICTA